MPDPKVTAAMRYLQVDPRDPSRGRFAIAGADALSSEEEDEARAQVLAKNPAAVGRSKIRYRMGGGPLDDAAGNQLPETQVYEAGFSAKPVETLAIDRVQKSLSDRAAEREFQRSESVKDSDLRRQKELMAADPRNQMAMARLQMMQEDRAESKSAREFEREQARQDKADQYAFKTAREGKDYTAEQSANAFLVNALDPEKVMSGGVPAEDTSVAQAAQRLMVEQGMDPRAAIAAVRAERATKFAAREAKDEAKKAKREERVASILPTVAQRDPSMAAKLAGGLESFEGIPTEALFGVPDDQAAQALAPARERVLAAVQSGDTDMTTREVAAALAKAQQLGATPAALEQFKNDLFKEAQEASRLTHGEAAMSLVPIWNYFTMSDFKNRRDAAGAAMGRLRG